MTNSFVLQKCASVIVTNFFCLIAEASGALLRAGAIAAGTSVARGLFSTADPAATVPAPPQVAPPETGGTVATQAGAALAGAPPGPVASVQTGATPASGTPPQTTQEWIRAQSPVVVGAIEPVAREGGALIRATAIAAGRSAIEGLFSTGNAGAAAPATRSEDPGGIAATAAVAAHAPVAAGAIAPPDPAAVPVAATPEQRTTAESIAAQTQNVTEVVAPVAKAAGQLLRSAAITAGEGLTEGLGFTTRAGTNPQAATSAAQAPQVPATGAEASTLGAPSEDRPGQEVGDPSSSVIRHIEGQRDPVVAASRAVGKAAGQVAVSALNGFRDGLLPGGRDVGSAGGGQVAAAASAALPGLVNGTEGASIAPSDRSSSASPGTFVHPAPRTSSSSFEGTVENNAREAGAQVRGLVTAAGGAFLNGLWNRGDPQQHDHDEPTITILRPPIAEQPPTSAAVANVSTEQQAYRFGADLRAATAEGVSAFAAGVRGQAAPEASAQRPGPAIVALEDGAATVPTATPHLPQGGESGASSSSSSVASLASAVGPRAGGVELALPSPHGEAVLSEHFREVLQLLGIQTREQSAEAFRFANAGAFGSQTFDQFSAEYDRTTVARRSSLNREQRLQVFNFGRASVAWVTAQAETPEWKEASQFFMKKAVGWGAGATWGLVKSGAAEVGSYLNPMNLFRQHRGDASTVRVPGPAGYGDGEPGALVRFDSATAAPVTPPASGGAMPSRDEEARAGEPGLDAAAAPVAPAGQGSAVEVVPQRGGPSDAVVTPPGANAPAPQDAAAVASSGSRWYKPWTWGSRRIEPTAQPVATEDTPRAAAATQSAEPPSSPRETTQPGGNFGSQSVPEASVSRPRRYKGNYKNRVASQVASATTRMASQAASAAVRGGKTLLARGSSSSLPEQEADSAAETSVEQTGRQTGIEVRAVAEGGEQSAHGEQSENRSAEPPAEVAGGGSGGAGEQDPARAEDAARLASDAPPGAGPAGAVTSDAAANQANGNEGTAGRLASIRARLPSWPRWGRRGPSG